MLSGINGPAMDFPVAQLAGTGAQFAQEAFLNRFIVMVDGQSYL